MTSSFEKLALNGGPKTRSEFLVFSKPHFGKEEEDEVLVLRADLIQRKEVDSNYYETFNDYGLSA